MGEAFDRAWGLVKMPYFHGTSSKYDKEIKETGLDPSNNLSSLEQWNIEDLDAWLEEHELDFEDFDPDKDWTWFSKDNPKATMAYALSSNNNAGISRFSPIIYEIDDSIDVLEDLNNDGEFRGSYRTDETVPPHKIKEWFRFRPGQKGEPYYDYREKLREAIKQKAKLEGYE